MPEDPMPAPHVDRQPRQDVDRGAGDDLPMAEELEAASADAFTALEFAHRYGDRYPELSDAVIRRAAEH